MIDENIKMVEITIEELQEAVKLAEALIRLQDNPDFNLVVNKGYLQDDAIRLVHLRADPSQQTPEHQATIDKQIDGIGSLINYFRRILSMASTARDEIADHQETLEALRNE